MVPYDCPEKALDLIRHFVDEIPWLPTDKNEEGQTRIQPLTLENENQEIAGGDDAEDPLVLTDYVAKKQFDKARQLSRVDHKEMDAIAPSHSGFFRVNDTRQSNQFFWFVPATNVRSSFFKNVKLLVPKIMFPMQF